jgi:hypothetical protein
MILHGNISIPPDLSRNKKIDAKSHLDNFNSRMKINNYVINRANHSSRSGVVHTTCWFMKTKEEFKEIQRDGEGVD